MIVTYEGTQAVLVGPAGEQLEFTLDFLARGEVHYTPGRLGGPPEDCYPDDSECDVIELTLIACRDDEGNPVTVHPGASGRMLIALDRAAIEQGLWKAYYAEIEQAQADRAEAAADRSFDE